MRAGDGDDTIAARDGNAEPIACGLGTDTLTADFVDVPVGCERTALGPPPPGADTRKPKVRISGLPARPRWHHVRSGLRPRIGADEPAAFVVELLGAATTAHISARKPFNLTLVRRTIALHRQGAPHLPAPEGRPARPAAQAARPDPRDGDRPRRERPRRQEDDQARR